MLAEVVREKAVLPEHEDERPRHEDEPPRSNALLGTAWILGLLAPALWRQCDVTNFAPKTPAMPITMDTNVRLSALIALVLLFSWATVYQTRGKPVTTALACITSLCACWLGRWWTDVPVVLVLDILPWGVNLGLTLGLFLTRCNVERV